MKQNSVVKFDNIYNLDYWDEYDRDVIMFKHGSVLINVKHLRKKTKKNRVCWYFSQYL